MECTSVIDCLPNIHCSPPTPKKILNCKWQCWITKEQEHLGTKLLPKFHWLNTTKVYFSLTCLRVHHFVAAPSGTWGFPGQRSKGKRQKNQERLFDHLCIDTHTISSHILLVKTAYVTLPGKSKRLRKRENIVISEYALLKSKLNHIFKGCQIMC
jgi:hypothetical protein